MKRNEGGFTLLETCISFVLFAIIIESIWGFFSTIYINYLQFEQQVSMNSERINVEDFIKREIRSADKVRILTTSGEQIEVTYKTSTNNVEVKDKLLKSIKYRVKVPKTIGIGYEEKECEIVLRTVSTIDGTKGTKELSYSVKAKGGIPVATNYTVISEMIENIKVTSYKDSDLVEFTCEFQKRNENNNKLKITKRFIESLEYKEHY